MKRSIGRVFALAVVTCSMLGIVSAGAFAGYVRQFAAQYLNFDGTEQSTARTPTSGGQTIYHGTVMVPADVDTLEVSISATGDLLDTSGKPVSNSMWLNCQVDEGPCNGGKNSAGNSVAGWVPVLSLTAPAQIPDPTPTPTTQATGNDNNIHYTWCMPIKPKTGGGDRLVHEVDLKMASGDGIDTVNIEQIHVFVNGTKIGGANKSNACTMAPVPTPVP